MSEKTIWSMLMWPQPSELRSTISMRACLPFQVGDIPTGRLQGFAILARRGADHLAADAEIDAGLAGIVAAADQETDVAPLDEERPRRGRALRAHRRAGTY